MVSVVVIAVFNELCPNRDRLIRSTSSDELGAFRGLLPLPCEFTGLEMLHLPLQLGCICNAVVSTVKIGSHIPYERSPSFSAQF